MERDKIIGQDKLLDMFDRMITDKTLPRFITLTGMQGSGRKTIAQYIADKLNAPLYKPEDSKVTVGYVREITEQAYKQTDTIVYLLPDVDYFNLSAANALLKVTEEPPNNAYFILTCCDGRSVPSTLRSRCITYRLETYTIAMLKDFAESLNVTLNTNEILKLCNTPGEIVKFVGSQLDYNALEEFTNKVIDNIGKVSGANVFKIDESIAFKDDDTGFNLNTFWTMFCNISLQRTKDLKSSKRSMYFSYIRVTSEYRQKLIILGINKRSLFDLWLVEMREIYNRYN